MTSSTAAAETFDDVKRDAFAERVFSAGLGFADTALSYIGDRLGLYAALASGAPLTPGELAALTGTDERYIREWLEQQAATGYLDLASDSADACERRYTLPAEHAEVLADRDSVNWLAPFARQMVGSAAGLPAVLDAFRTGEGVPYAAYGADVIEGQADINRAAFLQLLGKEWLPQIGDVHERLQAGPARVADIACGAAWSSIAIAHAYPQATVDGFDLDEASIEMARANIAADGLQDRVHANLQDAGDPSLRGRYDLVVAFECVHDFSHPVDVLRTMRGLTADGGAVIIMDERTQEDYTAPASDTDRLFYAWSVLLCLPSGRATDGTSAATGTVMRPSTLAAYAEDAGFSRTEVLPIEHPTFRFYRLWP
jgi:2-polyprenyl-3-methyl-5-hydroxy-6-metoxy-1,4-benzoquinol methylase